MISFYQFLESQEEAPPPPQIIQRSIPVGGFGGWKIHLTTGLDDHKRDLAYATLLRIIEHSGSGNWKSKKLTGGDPGDKDITLYCGPKEEAIKEIKEEAETKQEKKK